MFSPSISNQSLKVFTSPYIEENMYLLIKEDKALVIDPNGEKEALDLLKQNNIQEITIFLTHEHPDHTCGVPILQKNFKTKLICQQACAEYISDKVNNRSMIIELILLFQDEKKGTHNADFYPYPQNEYECQADITFKEDFSYEWQGEHFVFCHTPGHSQGSCCIIWNDKAVFTGDSLLKNMPVITRFPGGNTKQYHEITKPYLDSLSGDIIVLAGHGESFMLKEIREKVA